MKSREAGSGLLLLGAGRRIAAAAVAVALLWAGFFWATGSVGPL